MVNAAMLSHALSGDALFAQYQRLLVPEPEPTVATPAPSLAAPMATAAAAATAVAAATATATATAATTTAAILPPMVVVAAAAIGTGSSSMSTAKTKRSVLTLSAPHDVAVDFSLGGFDHGSEPLTTVTTAAAVAAAVQVGPVEFSCGVSEDDIAAAMAEEAEAEVEAAAPAPPRRWPPSHTAVVVEEGDPDEVKTDPIVVPRVPMWTAAAEISGDLATPTMSTMAATAAAEISGEDMRPWSTRVAPLGPKVQFMPVSEHPWGTTDSDDEEEGAEVVLPLTELQKQLLVCKKNPVSPSSPPPPLLCRFFSLFLLSIFSISTQR
jgi:hypothetical protein